jgi:hypothetical protein
VTLAERQLAALREVAGDLDEAGLAYWLFGGFAVDFHAGELTRRHGDVDLAVLADDAHGIAERLLARGWVHRPNPDEDGGTGYERKGVRLELTFVVVDQGRVEIVFREHRAVWSESPFGDERRQLLGVQARVVPRDVLTSEKS